MNQGSVVSVQHLRTMVHFDAPLGEGYINSLFYLLQVYFHSQISKYYYYYSLVKPNVETPSVLEDIIIFTSTIQIHQVKAAKRTQLTHFPFPSFLYGKLHWLGFSPRGILTYKEPHHYPPTPLSTRNHVHL